MPPPKTRPNQRRRTRKDLLQAAARLLQQGRKPTLEDVAAEALVSRATAYRYFPNIDALHLEASLDLAIPEPSTLFPKNSPAADAASRVQHVDTLFHDMIRANEIPLRMMLIHSLQRIIRGNPTKKFPARQNRRTPCIAAALAPHRRQFTPASLRLLTNSLALLVGTESMLVFQDVLQLSDAESRQTKHWAIRALIAAAQK